jgi:hypothetical protein
VDGTNQHHDEGTYLSNEDEKVPDLSKIGGCQVREVREGALEENKDSVQISGLHITDER